MELAREEEERRRLERHPFRLFKPEASNNKLELELGFGFGFELELPCELEIINYQH